MIWSLRPISRDVAGVGARVSTHESNHRWPNVGVLLDEILERGLCPSIVGRGGMRRERRGTGGRGKESRAREHLAPGARDHAQAREHRQHARRAPAAAATPSPTSTAPAPSSCALASGAPLANSFSA